MAKMGNACGYIRTGRNPPCDLVRRGAFWRVGTDFVDLGTLSVTQHRVSWFRKPMGRKMWRLLGERC
jgi:hypothetical protein